jgi:hypothetical protein
LLSAKDSAGITFRNLLESGRAEDTVFREGTEADISSAVRLKAPAEIVIF